MTPSGFPDNPVLCRAWRGAWIESQHRGAWVLVDGSGAPGVRGDLAIRDGCIAALGDVRGSADRTLEVDGRIVAPGFVDIHTHYDAQVRGGGLGWG